MEGLEEGARKNAERVREEMAAEETQKALQVMSLFPSTPTIYYIHLYLTTYVVIRQIYIEVHALKFGDFRNAEYSSG